MVQRIIADHKKYRLTIRVEKDRFAARIRKPVQIVIGCSKKQLRDCVK